MNKEFANEHERKLGDNKIDVWDFNHVIGDSVWQQIIDAEWSILDHFGEIEETIMPDRLVGRTQRSER